MLASTELDLNRKQDRDAGALEKARQLWKGDRLRKKGIYYLEHEALSFKTESGRTWKVYGSPVSDLEHSYISNLEVEAAPRYAWGAFQYDDPAKAKGKKTMELRRTDLTEGTELYDRIPEDVEILNPYPTSRCLFLLAGDPAAEDEPVRKGTCFQQWLLGYEFPSTFFLFQKDKISVLCSASKAKILAQVEKVSGIPPMDIYAQAKGKDAPNDAVTKFFEQYQTAKRVGALLKENHTGKLVTEWQKAVDDAATKPESVEMGPAVSVFMAVKDQEELKLMQTAAQLTSTLLKHHVAPKLESILDKESKISHDMLSAQIETRLGSGEGDNAKGPDMKVWGKAKGLDNIDWPSAEFCYPPIIISKASKSGYDLRYTIESTEDNIAHKGVLLASFGLKYRTYATNIGRTFIVDPTQDQEAQYNLLLSLQQEMVSFIKDGVQAKEVYQHALDFVKERHPELEKHFVKNLVCIGMEFRDGTYVLSPKNTRTLKANMTLNLGLGFSDLSDKNGNKYALHVDTIRVDSTKSILLTDGVKSSKETLFFLDAESDAEKPKKKPPVQPKANGASAAKVKTVGGKVLRNQRAVQDEVRQGALSKLVEHQRDLHEQLQQNGLEKFSEGGGGTGGKEGKSWKKFQSYKGDGGLPNEAEKLRVFVDRKAQSVILPIHGFAVPFHINTIKNASKSDEGDFTYLRINFQTPGQLAGKKEDTPFEDPDATFIRSVSLVKQITELKKEANKREQQKKEMADVIEQDKLIEVRGRRPYKLSEAFIRPALDGKHVLFSNVKHLFFQPCDHELLTIVHLHLRAPIIIGKKKTFDVQFFREATDVQFDETGNRKRKHRYGDEDEIEMEQQQERKRRATLNKEVKAFAEKIAEAASNSLGETLEVDVPFRELSFEGVPFRTSARLQPTTDCLVHLTDPPFLVDFTKAPLHINSIATGSMDDVKNWLDSVDIPMAEGPVNLNWGPIMKHINENPYEFFQGGGWSFLGGAPGAEDNRSESSESESDSRPNESDESAFSDEGSFSDDSGSDDFDDE
ncbi:FACT complex subunit SPT16 [Coprinopsis sp. MPI-PUGE-AT-0042]|nr:FACT complex subunit SPT16 [Coprinopsis sp. MPI-PUGE-AT-0042]